MPHEADGVGEGVDATIRRRGTTGGGVEGGEEGILDEHSGTGQPVEQGGLPRVGVSDDGGGGYLVAKAISPLGGTGGLDALETTTQHSDAMTDTSSVGFDPGLTGATTTDTGATSRATTRLTGEVSAPATQPLLEVVELGQFDLSTTFHATSVLGEDVEDQRRPVHHLDLDAVLEVSKLSGVEFTITNDGVSSGGSDHLGELSHLARTDVGRRIRGRSPLHDGLEDL